MRPASWAGSRWGAASRWFPVGHFLQTPRLSTSIDPRRGEGVRKHSASTSPFLSRSPLLIGPQLEMPAQESTTCRAPLPWSFRSRRLSRDWEVSSGLPLPSPQAKLGKLWLLPPPSGAGGDEGCPTGCGQPLASGPWAPRTAQPGPGQRCTGWLGELSPGTMEPFKQPGLCNNDPLGLCRWLDGV